MLLWKSRVERCRNGCIVEAENASCVRCLVLNVSGDGAPESLLSVIRKRRFNWSVWEIRYASNIVG